MSNIAAFLLPLLIAVVVVDGYRIEFKNSQLPVYHANEYRQKPFYQVGIFSRSSTPAKVGGFNGIYPTVSVNITAHNVPDQFLEVYVYNAPYIEEFILPSLDPRRKPYHPCMDVGQQRGVAKFPNASIEAYTLDSGSFILQGVPDSNRSVFIYERLYLQSTGLYIITLNSCKYKTRTVGVNHTADGTEDLIYQERYLDVSRWQNVRIDGSISVKNPYGFLLGQQYGYLPAYICLFIWCLTYTVVYAFAMCRLGFRKALRYHWLLLATTGISTAVYFIFTVYFSVLNQYDKHQHGLYVFATVLVLARSTLTRVAAYLLVMGWSITVRTVPYEKKIFVVIGGIAHFLLYLANFIFTELTSPGVGGYDKADLPIVAETTVSIVTFLFEVFVCCAIAYELRRTLARLRISGEKVKLKMFRWTSYALLPYPFACLLWIAFSEKYIRQNERLWQAWWVNETIWDLFYVLVLAPILCIWFPSRRSLYYHVGSDDVEGEEAGEDDVNHRASPSGDIEHQPARQRFVAPRQHLDTARRANSASALTAEEPAVLPEGDLDELNNAPAPAAMDAPVCRGGAFSRHESDDAFHDDEEMAVQY